MDMDKSTESTTSIIDRLEKLKQWQEDQKKILTDKQNAQRKLLGMEQKKMYELFGLSPAKQSGSIADDGDKSILSQQLADLGLKELVDSQNSYACSSPPIPPGQENFYQEQQNPNIPKKPFLKRGQGLVSRFKIDPEALRLSNLPKYKYANVHKGRFEIHKNAKFKETKAPQKNRLSLEKPTVKESFKKEEIKPTMCDDIDSKIEMLLNENSSVIELCGFSSKFQSENNSADIDQMNHPPVSWATVLNPDKPKPIQFERFHTDTSVDASHDETDNLSIFELIEKKAAEGSFNIKNSFIQRWIAEKAKKIVDDMDDDNKIEIDDNLKELHPPPAQVNSLFDSDSYVTIEEEEVDNTTEINQPHVRFSEHVQINEVESDTESTYELLNHSKTSTPYDKLKSHFHAAKEISSTSSVEDETLIDDKIGVEEEKREFMEKTEYLKIRLVELEKELAMFQNNNLELIKLKQQHEVEKAHLEQEKIELFEKINDEKLKMEIHLHDERMKIEDDRKKLAKMIKDQKVPNRKEREEIAKLKEEVEKLEKELQNRDTKHVTAQSRLRAQIRNYERDSKEFNTEIDELKKQVKKLEADNIRLSRESNNKMLNEINRNIAKLAPKENVEPIQATEVRNKNCKTIMAKVISHKKQPVAGPPIKSKSKSHKKKVVNSTTTSSDSENIEEAENSYSTASSSSEDGPSKSTYFPKRSKSRNRRSKSMEGKKEPAKRDSLSESSFKREIQNSDGSKDIWYPNGNLKKISADGMTIRMLYFNKDIKETNINEGTVKYYYSETNTWHTTYLDGLEILEFPNGQTEHRYKDGTVEVHFPNGSIRVSNPGDETKSEEWRYPDGTNLIQMKNGDKVLSLPNGQKEIHTQLHRRREYPDGTVKLVYPDGSQETRYSNGRVRLKDKAGNLVMDSINNNY